MAILSVSPVPNSAVWHGDNAVDSFGRCLVQFSPRTLAVLTGFYGFRQLNQADAVIVA